MTYREQLNKAREMGINIVDLIIADECESNFRFDYTEKEFDKLCEFSRNIYLKADGLTAEAIANCIDGMLSELGYTVSDVLRMDKRKFIGTARQYV